MARTSRKHSSFAGAGHKIQRAAGHIRLSVVKDNQGRDSIENQKAILQAALEKKDGKALQQFSRLGRDAIQLVICLFLIVQAYRKLPLK